MKGRRDYITVITIMLLIIAGVAGVFSLNLGHSYEVMNQYGQAVQIYGYGVYAHDSYFQATISIGTDIGVLFMLVPLFIYAYINFIKKGDGKSRLSLISVYSAALYYALSITMGITYNRLFLVYVALLSCSMFGMFIHISKMHLETPKKVSRGLQVFFIISGVALIVAWLPDVIPTILKGTPLGIIGIYHTCVTYVLDMGIIAPLCFTCIFLLNRGNALGLMIEACILKLCMIIALMMFTQSICQLACGIITPIPVFVTKNLSFILLGIFAFYFNRKLYSCLVAKEYH